VFNYAMIYDLDKKIWFNQSTTFFDGEKPIVRTRFCGAVVYGEETNTWEYVLSLSPHHRVSGLTIL
jgi:hypothetical protein